MSSYLRSSDALRDAGLPSITQGGALAIVSFFFLTMLLPSVVSSQRLAKPYLVTYNVIAWLLWAKIGIDLCRSQWVTPEGRREWFPLVSTQVQVAMTLALAEVLHAAVGLVKSNPLVTASELF
eukprot:Gregarina_sp_Poly_1__695@NODE_1166_length_4878_cov_75_636042_g524_i3_p4_GENE_NODE_1166_length_4878_cov_75_636042_g524_i3NODE_1166_length_4878_cov_75_636042_g524_i3_p4_ORF_typecomplete_len123_score16_84PTPLA/PF04387_14/2_6e02PTPLA/PF04387_14/0_002_NODE_1166_length_4878_cov_75_636042_g524_i3101469